MAYLNEDGLARYDGLIKNWTTFKSGTVDGIDPLLNWQKTEAASSVTFYPLPAAPLDPVVNFLFTETGPAEGTKGPDNPSTITGVTQAKVTRCGKNLLVFPYPDTTKSDSGITWTVNDDGSVTASGTAESTAFFYFSFSNNTHTNPGMQYTLSGCPAGGSSSTYALRYGTSGYETGSGYTFTASANLGVVARIASGTVISTPITFKPQLELGSAATAFEPYSGADYAINLGGTYYGGSVDLSTGVMTVTWGGETITTISTCDAMYTNTIRFVANTVANHKSVSYTDTSLACNKFVVANNQNDVEHCRLAGANDGTQFYLFIAKSRLDVSGAADPSNPTKAEWNEAARAWLAENPVFIAFELATPHTVQITAPALRSLVQPDKYTPRLNTIYTDAFSVQVGYAKSPIRSEYELAQVIAAIEESE